MATTAIPGAIPARGPVEDNYLTHSSGFWSWAATLDHKRIGVMYLISILLMFFVGGMAATAIRIHLMVPQGLLFSHDTYNKFFSVHGIIMVFLVIIPGVPAALGNFVLPIMLGAKDVAFLRLNLISYYMYVTGALLAIYTLAMGGVNTGWTFYTPYSTSSQSVGLVSIVTAAFILGFSSIFTGLNFIVTIHKLRPPGMSWFRLPLFLWAVYATAIIQVLATPVLGITLLLLIVEKTLHMGIFDPKLGGDPVLFQHFFWFYSHPAVYIMILPAMGVISEIIAVHSRKHIFGYKMIAFSSIAIAIFGFLVWGHHMFTSGQSQLMNMIFSALTYSVSIPSAIKVFNWLATIYRGSLQLNTAMLYGLGFIFIFMIGGLTGLFLGALAVDVHLQDTYFVIAHFHYVMMGSAILAFVAGIHHWWPKITGRMYNENWGRIGWALIFIGFNGTFLPQFVMGTQGMPRRYAQYIPMYQPYHVASSVGAIVMALGFLFTAFYLLHSLYRGRKAPANPWGGATLEWACSSPPPHDNFAFPPPVTDPYDYSNLVYDEKIGGYVPRAPQPGTPTPAPATVGH